jgi:mannitol-specific phosphotransferase system IIBC component
MEHLFDNTTKAGTAAGTMLTILVNISSADLLKTAVLAAIGAAVSFVVTLLLKALVRYLHK